jgi:hypothetical protein
VRTPELKFRRHIVTPSPPSHPSHPRPQSG